MSKKDYERFAAEIRQLALTDNERDAAVLVCVRVFADNPRFDRARFEQACQVPDEPHSPTYAASAAKYHTDEPQ